jgi:hypothetical protein
MVINLFRGGAASRPPVISRQRPGGRVCMLRVQDQAKQAAYTGPPISNSISEGQPSDNTSPKQENNKGTPGRSQVPQADPPVTRLHNSDKRHDREKQQTIRGLRRCKNIYKTEA